MSGFVDFSTAARGELSGESEAARELEEVQVAIDGGAEVNAQDSEGNTALMLAAQHNFDWGVATALIKGGTGLGLKNSRDQTILDVAIERVNVYALASRCTA